MSISKGDDPAGYDALIEGSATPALDDPNLTREILQGADEAKKAMTAPEGLHDMLDKAVMTLLIKLEGNPDVQFQHPELSIIIEHIAKLKSQILAYVDKRERLARIDELDRLVRHTMLGALGEPYNPKYISARLEALTNSKGGSDDA